MFGILMNPERSRKYRTALTPNTVDSDLMNHVILIIVLISFHFCFGIVRTRQEFINAQARNGYTALHYAVEKNYPEAALPLLEEKANPLIESNQNKTTALKLALDHKWTTEPFRLLVEQAYNYRPTDEQKKLINAFSKSNGDSIIQSLIADAVKNAAINANRGEEQDKFYLVSGQELENLKELATTMQNNFGSEWNINNSAQAPVINFKHLVIPMYKKEELRSDRNHTLHGFHYDPQLQLNQKNIYTIDKQGAEKENVYYIPVKASIENIEQNLGPKTFFPYNWQSEKVCKVLAQALRDNDSKTLQRGSSFWIFHSKPQRDLTFKNAKSSIPVRIQFWMNNKGFVYTAFPNHKFDEGSSEVSTGYRQPTTPNNQSSTQSSTSRSSSTAQTAASAKKPTQRGKRTGS